MDPLTLLVGAALGGAVVAAFFLGRRSARAPEARAPEARAPEARAPEARAPEARAPARQVEDDRDDRQPEVREVQAEEPAPSPAPELELVAYRCPQCGATVEIPPRGQSVRCAYCDAAIRIEGRRAPPSPRGPDRQRDWEPWGPPREATLNAYTFGRFELALLRQACHAAPREAMRWLPLGERHAGLFVLRVVSTAGRERSPDVDPSVLEALARAAEARLRERRDPGLAVKAALQALADSGAPGELEAFAAVFDAELSQVIACNAGCPSALIHCSVEEARPIDVTRSRQPLGPVALRGKQDPFSNQGPIQLAAGDAVLAISAVFGGEGRGWPAGPGSTFRALREVFPGPDPEGLAVAVKDKFWDERNRSRSSERPPVGDLLIAAVHVRSNLDLHQQDVGTLPALETFATETFELALVPSARGYCEQVALHSRRHALVWIEGLAADDPRARTVRDTVVALLDGETGANDNPRRGGREGFAAAGIDDPQVRALVLFLDDRHGKLAFWARGGWVWPCELRTRGGQGSALQVYDEGGEMWLRRGGRALFLGAAPVVGQAPRRDDSIPGAWPGGKASALYELCRQQEDVAGTPDFLNAALRAIRTDAPGAELCGLAVVTRTGDNA